MKIITNKPIPSRFETLLKNEANEKDILFAVVGDLNLKGRYAESAVFFTEDKLVAFDECHNDGVYTLNYDDIETAQVKRLYVNAVFRVTLKTGAKKFF